MVDDHFTIVKGDNPAGLRISSINIHEYIATLTWNSVPGRYYIVQFIQDATAPDWQDVSGPILATESSTGWSDFVPGDTAAGFFRVFQME